VNPSDMIDTGWLRRLALSAALLLLLGVGAWFLWPGGTALAWVGAALVVAALVPLGMQLLQLRSLHQTAKRQLLAANAQRQENERNQRSILKLLDEMASLADGDLTVQATVTEDITGAIADAVNYAVEALRKLVATINQSALQLDSAARQTQSLGVQLVRHGIKANRKVLETAASYSHEQGLTSRPVALEEVFAASAMEQ